MEPGTFKDRILLESTPHQLIEGMILSAYAIGADQSFVFLRWAYHNAAHAIEEAIHEAYAAGYLGKKLTRSYYNGNGSQGKLVSANFIIQKKKYKFSYWRRLSPGNCIYKTCGEW